MITTRGSKAPDGEWTPVLEEFTEHLRGSDRKWATSKQYVQCVRWLSEQTDSPPWDVTTHDLATWLDGQPWSAATRARVIVALRTFYTWGVTTGRLDFSPAAGLASSRLPQAGPKRMPIPEGWREEVEAYIQWCRSANCTEQTLQTRIDHLRHLAQYAASPWRVTPEQLALYLSNAEWAPATRRAKRSTIRSFFAWGEANGRVTRSPAEHLPSVRAPRTLPRPAPEDALREAFSRADDRMRLILMLGAYAGLRRAEIARVHTQDLGDGALTVHGKGGHLRMVPLHPDLEQELRAEITRRRRGERGTGFSVYASVPGYLFPSDYSPHEHLRPRWIGTLVARAMPDGWTAHTLRHRFATSAYAVERDLLVVQNLLGHSKPESTAGYAQVPDGAKRSAVAGVGLRW